MDMLETTLKSLMMAGLAGDGRAHEALLSGCAVRLRGYYSKRLPHREADVEDLVQDTLMAIHKRREAMMSRSPSLRGCTASRATS